MVIQRGIIANYNMVSSRNDLQRHANLQIHNKHYQTNKHESKLHLCPRDLCFQDIVGIGFKYMQEIPSDTEISICMHRDLLK